MIKLANIEIGTDDFPRELDERRRKVLKFERLKKLVKIKDEIIWNLVNDEMGMPSQINQKAQNEVSQWAK